MLLSFNASITLQLISFYRIYGPSESDTLEQLHLLKVQLEQLRLAQRDASLKSRREQTVLKRFIATLSRAHIGSHPRIDEKLIELRHELEHNADISSLIPRFAILERLIAQKSAAVDKQNTSLDEQLRRSGETLQRISGCLHKLNVICAWF